MNTKLNKILLGILIYLATIILITTIFAFTQKKQNNNNSLFAKDLQPNPIPIIGTREISTCAAADKVTSVIKTSD